MTSEKLRWIHDCTHTKGHKMYGDPVERSLGHWFAACPHCAKPNPYHEKPTPPASHNAAYGPGSASSVEAAHMLMTGSMPEKVSLASHDAGEAVAEVYSHQSRDMCKVSTLHARFSRSVPVGTKLYPESALTTLTAEVSRLTVALAEVSAALPGPVYMDPPDGGDVSLAEQVRRMAAELEKETAHSKHLAGAVSRKIDELIAAENQCGYYKMQYSRAEQVRKEACEANAKAQAAMLWLEADLERSRKECEALREVLHTAMEALRHSRPWDAGDVIKAALSAGEQHE
ncbi:MAG: hypothetical protein WA154_10970 [Moraxellaceae bacterium]